MWGKGMQESLKVVVVVVLSSWPLALPRFYSSPEQTNGQTWTNTATPVLHFLKWPAVGNALAEG